MYPTTFILTATLLAATAASAQDFYDYWGDGRAEVSSYQVVQPRYGELRRGHGVLVFVTEDLHRNTLIKVESPTPEEDRIYTLKLNDILKFTTGIYDYSVMTSVFSAVAPLTEQGPFELLKVSLSAQEWCGHVFEQFVVRRGRIAGRLFSYFEREGERTWGFGKPADFASEDHLLIEIRELKGPFMETGATRALTLLPSLWQFRLQHRERGLVEARLTKAAPDTVSVGGATYTAVPWSWTYGERRKTVWVDTAYPHRILKWRASDGGQGELMVSKRLPYWSQHALADEYLRDELEIPR